MQPTTKHERRELARLLSIAEVADALGVDVRHVRRLVYERRIPYIKWGHLLRFDPADIAAWIDAYRSTPRLAGGDDHRRR
ncbi:MAG TPA: helix-turn-helix domain-containing protein [Ilumatobacteraceae bacterium]|jgi:excisionase family DNA binding protein